MSTAIALAKILNAQIPIIGEWADYTPSTNGLGTPTISFARWRQVGSSIELMIRLILGTVTAVEARVGLPGSYVIATGLSNDILGVSHIDAANSNQVSAIGTATNGYLNFGYRNGTDAFIRSPRTGTQIFTTGQPLTVNAMVPIFGLSPTQKLEPLH